VGTLLLDNGLSARLVSDYYESWDTKRSNESERGRRFEIDV
jgi:hypothetical protein